MDNYPKVCAICSMPHIRCFEEEKVIDNGKRVIHVDCEGKEPWDHNINGCYTDNRKLYGLENVE